MVVVTTCIKSAEVLKGNIQQVDLTKSVYRYFPCVASTLQKRTFKTVFRFINFTTVFQLKKAILTRFLHCFLSWVSYGIGEIHGRSIVLILNTGS